LGRKITHVKMSEDESVAMFEREGIPKDYARMYAQLDTHVKEGKEEIQNDVVLHVTGKEPERFEEFVDKCVRKGIWVKT